jgi:hypothetical protein
MNISRCAAATALLLLGACAGRATSNDSPVANDSFGSLNGAAVRLETTGGFAALSTSYRAQHDDGSYAYTLRHICSTSCGAAIDSGAGTLAPNVADSLFSIIAAASPLGLEKDYGRTTGGADMLEYTLRIDYEGETKIVHADDGTMPDSMRRIVDAVRGMLAPARK